MDIDLNLDVAEEIPSEKGDCKIDSNENNFKDSSTEDVREDPRAGMQFSSEEEVRSYFQKYAYDKGFGIKKVSAKSSSDGHSKYYSLACARGGKRVSASMNTFHARPSTRIGCKAKINVVVSNDGSCSISCSSRTQSYP